MTDLILSSPSSGGQGDGFNWLQLVNSVVGLSENNDPIVRENRRLEALQLLTARPGQPMARVFGRMRVGGHIIWRGELVEHIRESGGGGGKGGGPRTPRSRRFSYSMDLAIGLCEGPISHIGRVWADGQLLDMTAISMTLYKGDQAQMPDPTIAAQKGADNAPAFRGLAYLVLRGFDVTAFGNRVPQLSFEVFRPIGEKRATTRAVCLLPGATEFGYHPEQQIRLLGISRAAAENIHQSQSASDWEVSMDQLQQSHPQCRRVALVVSWFGTDLRAAQCRIEPRTDGRTKNIWPAVYAVNGRGRARMKEVSRIDGRAAFGGTPSDSSVIAAIRDLHRRGLEVMFYPFILMDIAAGNELANPYGGAAQPVFPWRGRISCHPAPGRPGSPDGTKAINTTVEKFARELDRMVRHYAELCRRAGGVEAFLLASELRGVSRLRNHHGDYPFAAALGDMAAHVRDVLPDSKISYAADWSEYGAYVPEDGALDFPLDAFWADKNCDFIGIDNYLPLADWREGAAHLDAQAGAEAISDTAYLQANIEGGEYYDWYYEDAAARDRQTRKPISDGLGKPWVYRAKDIKGWWSNAHIRRANGRETETTAWRAKSKPIWFTELGCPAVDKGANQPNIFPDTRSDEGGLPHYSTGARDDDMQQAFLHAVTDYYAQKANNPSSPHYGGRMVDVGQIYFWAWDARPFPAFPYRADIWSDGANWHTGHWLNGRDGSAPLGALISALTAPIAHRIEPMRGAPDGFAMAGPVRIADALKPILRGFGIDALPGAHELRFAGRSLRPVRAIAEADILRDPPPRRNRDGSQKLKRFDLHYIDAEGDYGPTHVSARHQGGDAPVARLNLPVALSASLASHLAERLLHEARMAEETVSLTLSPKHLDLEVGDIIQFKDDTWRLRRVSYNGRLSVTAVRHIGGLYAAQHYQRPRLAASGDARVALPHIELLDMARPAHRADGFEAHIGPLLAAAATPWPGQVDAVMGGRRIAVSEPSQMGQLLAPLKAGPVGRWDRGTQIEVEVFTGVLSGLPEGDILAGANRLALQTERGWEVMQFARAELVGARRYRLSHVLRGQFGTDAAMAEIAPAESLFTLLDDHLVPLQAGDGDAVSLRYGIAGAAEDSYSWREKQVALRHAAARCLAPVHAKLVIPKGRLDTWHVSWIRRTRLGGDDFAAPDVPLGEPQELYQSDILAGGKTVSSRRHGEAGFSLSAKSRKKLATGQNRRAVWSVRISQINGQGAAGASLTLPLPSLSKG